MIHGTLRYRQATLVAIYAALIVLANYLAFWLRFESLIRDSMAALMFQMLPWLVVIRIVTFIPFRLYEISWHSTGIWEFRNIILGVITSTVLFYLLVHWGFDLAAYPRLVFAIDALLLMYFMSVVFLTRLLYSEAVGLRGDKQAFLVRLSLLVSLVVASVGGTAALMSSVGVVKLPYDNSNPIIYDNDDTIDVYTDDYLMAAASAGDIKLVGMITSTSVAPYNKWVPASDCETALSLRTEGITRARNSGFVNIPDHVCGTLGHLRKPDSGKIQDTRPIGSKGSWLIVNEARKATGEKPLVMVMGGPLTVAADAYLLDNSIADKVVVAWLSGNDNMTNYNGWADGWAAYIVLEKLNLVHFAVDQRAVPYVPKSRLIELPDTKLRQWMIDKDRAVPNLPNLPGDHDLDAAPAISVMRPDYARKTKRVSFSHWSIIDGHEVPVFKDDPNGRTLVVTRASKNVATEEWWRALKNPAAYGGRAGNRPVSESRNATGR